MTASAEMSPTTTDDDRVTAYGMLLEAYAAIVRVVEQDLDAHAGMPLSWFEVLIRLSRSADERLRMSELASQVLFSTSGLTRLIDRMVEAGMVRREVCADDRRGYYAVLTADGRHALEKAMPNHLATLDRYIVEPIGPEALSELVSTLRTLRDNALGAASATQEDEGS